MTASAATYRLGLVLLATAALAWSTAGLFTRILQADTPTIQFGASLFGAIGTLLVIAMVPGTGGVRQFRAIGGPGVAYAALTALSMLLFISALRQTTVAHVAVITALVPFIAAYLGWAALREVPGRSAILASAVALIGVVVTAGLSRDGDRIGDVLAMLMAVCMAAMILIPRRFGDIPALASTCLASVFCTLAPLWVWLAFSETPQPAALCGGAIVLAAVLANGVAANRRLVARA